MPIACRCGQAGSTTWESAAAGPASRVGISSGFYERVRKKDYVTTDICCVRCDSVVVEPRIRPA